ncbi:MAG: proteobacterial dedicated sortase system response regulator [Candidatus Thiodiazotropha sp. (ex Notomyrtea botanica)]|nr:proteobacterial dedicated sortase system response regulator [Candidatus Thiodiazotropha sp. (ex Notomyrtea botanica)]
MANRKIAIIEDEAVIRDNYSDYLQRQGYQVSGYASRQKAITAFETGLPDLVVLDIGLEDDIDGGFELCRELRTRSATLPIIFLTARDSDFDTVAGLRLGADDYLTKDISLPHLAARIAALFRRLEAMTQTLPEAKRYICGALQLDIHQLNVQWEETPVALTVTEFWMIHALVKHPGHVRSRDQLMEQAKIYVDEASISSHIKRIRRKFQEIDPNFDHIESVYGAGYRWKY